MTYQIILSLHIISIVAWFAALFYLPRLYVYHVENLANDDIHTLFQTMERRLLRAIMNPAMIATWAFGLWLVKLNPHAMTGGGWLHVKLTLVLILSGFHGYLAMWRKRFMRRDVQMGSKFFRIINEVPTLILIAVVFLAVLKPF